MAEPASQMPGPESLREHALAFEGVCAELVGAMVATTEASEMVAACRQRLGVARAERLQGVAGKNAEQREAALPVALAREQQTLDAAERAERQAELACELTWLERDGLRYRLRALDAAARIAGGSA